MAWPAPRLWRTEHHGARNRVAEIVINSFFGDVCGLFIVIFSVPPSENPGCVRACVRGVCLRVWGCFSTSPSYIYMSGQGCPYRPPIENANVK